MMIFNKFNTFVIKKVGRYRWLFLLIALPVFLQTCWLDKPGPGKQVFINQGFGNKIVDGYWLYLPNNFDTRRSWPVILFLQGGYGASPDPKTSKSDGPVKYVFEKNTPESLYHFVADSFIIINPHMRTGPKEKRQWHQYGQTLTKIVDQVTVNYSGAKEKVYLTGLSRGGVGSWELAKQYPKKFAAILPISGVVTCKENCNKIKHLPTWIVHNNGDDIIDVAYPQGAVHFMEEEFGISFLKINDTQPHKETLGEKYIYSELPHDGHDAWNTTYASPEVYQWFLKNKKNSRTN